MPQRAKQPCRTCGAACDGPYCPRHRRERPGLRPRLSRSKRGYGGRHQLWRKLILARDPLCKLAILCDGTALATEADHIVPLSKGGDWSMENGQGACHRCHSHKTALENPGARGYGA